MGIKRKVIDISAWQDGLPIGEAVKEGVEAVIIRAGYGKTKDRTLDGFVAECKKRGVRFGFYWYSYALSIDRVKEEAAACIECIKPYKPDYPVYFDMEDQSQIDGLSSRTRTDMVITFCEAIREAGYTPGIYSNPSWFESYYKKKELLGRYDIWLACWTGSPDKPTRYNYGQRLWQWGLDTIAGYNVDGDLSYYDYNASGESPAPGEESEPEVQIGDVVLFEGGPHYVSSTAANATGGKRSPGLAKVMNIAPDAPHEYALRGVDGGSNVYGWVDKELVKPADQPLTIGDRVKVKKGAKTYRGGSLAGFVYNNVYIVMQIGAGVSPDYIVIGDGHQITAAVHAADLERVS